jgi:hypothetical protein
MILTSAELFQSSTLISMQIKIHQKNFDRDTFDMNRDIHELIKAFVDSWVLMFFSSKLMSIDMFFDLKDIKMHVDRYVFRASRYLVLI